MAYDTQDKQEEGMQAEENMPVRHANGSRGNGIPDQPDGVRKNAPVSNVAVNPRNRSGRGRQHKGNPNRPVAKQGGDQDKRVSKSIRELQRIHAESGRRPKAPASFREIKVCEIGEHMRYRVESRSRSGLSHLVDLLDNQCSCEQNQIRKVECAHLRAGYLHIGRMFVALVRKETGNE